MAFHIAQSLVQNDLFWGLGINTILAMAPISQYLQSAAQPIRVSTPKNIAAILEKPLPLVTVTDTVRDTLVSVTSWSKTTTTTVTVTTSSLNTTTTTLTRDKTYTSFVPSTTLTETKTQTLRKDHHVTHHIPSGTYTSVEYKTLSLSPTECMTSVGNQEPRSTETIYSDAVSPELRSSTFTKILLALLAIITFGLGMYFQTRRYRRVLRARKNIVDKVRGLGTEMAEMKTAHQRKEAESKDSISKVRSRLDRLKDIVKELDRLDIKDVYLDKDNVVEYDQVLPTLQAFRKTGVEKAVTAECLGMREKIESLEGRNKQLENQIHEIAKETDPKKGFDRILLESNTKLMLAEWKLEQFEISPRNANGTTTARSSN
jgi:hypothetical protein